MFIIVRMKNKRTGAEDRMNQNEKKEMKIRIAKEEDAEALLAIYAPYIEHTVITYEYDVPTVEEFRGRIRHVLERYPYLVAELNGEICGYAYASAFHDLNMYLKEQMSANRQRRQIKELVLVRLK